jgi:hypothetical protein
MNFIPKIIFLFFIILLSAVKTYSQTTVLKYDLDYHVKPKQEKLTCTARLSIDNQNDVLKLSIYRLLTVESVTDTAGNLIPFSQNIESIKMDDRLQVNKISIDLNETDVSSILIDYNGYLEGYPETKMSYVKDNISPSFTLLRMDAFAYPVTWDLIMQKGLQYFDYRVTLQVPDSLVVCNLGQLIEKKTIGSDIQYVYKNQSPAWRIDVAIGDYKLLESKNYRIYHFPKDTKGADKLLSSMENVHALYNQWFGQSKLSEFSIIELPLGYGCQTDVNGILQTADVFKSTDNLQQLYHEMSHLWNVHSTDAKPCRLESEGLAMFMQYYTAAELRGEPELLKSAANKNYKRVKEQLTNSKHLANTPIIDYGKENLTRHAYSQGMLFFYVLYKTVGEEPFFRTIREFYQTYEKGATTEEFAVFVAERLKQKETQTIVDQWILTNESSDQIINSKKLSDLY